MYPIHNPRVCPSFGNCSRVHLETKGLHEGRTTGGKNKGLLQKLLRNKRKAYLVISPSYLVISPSNLLMSPSYLLMSPSYLAISPSYLVISPSYLLISPSYLLFSPSYLLISPSYLVISPSLTWLVHTPRTLTLPIQTHRVNSKKENPNFSYFSILQKEKFSVEVYFV